MLGDIEIEKIRFYLNETPIFLKDLDIKKLLVSSNISFREKNYKYFIGYLYNNNKVKPLPLTLPKRSTYVKSYDEQVTGGIFY